MSSSRRTRCSRFTGPTLQPFSRWAPYRFVSRRFAAQTHAHGGSAHGGSGPEVVLSDPLVKGASRRVRPAGFGQQVVRLSGVAQERQSNSAPVERALAFHVGKAEPVQGLPSPTMPTVHVPKLSNLN